MEEASIMCMRYVSPRRYKLLLIKPTIASAVKEAHRWALFPIDF